jgi:hypothetical protein
VVSEVNQPLFCAIKRHFLSIYEEKTAVVQQISLAVQPNAGLRCLTDETGFVERSLRRIKDDARLRFAEVRAEE